MPKAPRQSSVLENLTESQHSAAVKSLNKHLKNCATNGKGCMLLKLAPSKPGGYVQLYVDKGLKVLAHQVALFDDYHVMRATFKRGEDVSHLCSNTLCINKSHLIQESSAKNQGRKNCPGKVTCPCGCNHTFDLCKCDPVHKCI